MNAARMQSVIAVALAVGRVSAIVSADDGSTSLSLTEVDVPPPVPTSVGGLVDGASTRSDLVTAYLDCLLLASLPEPIFLRGDINASATLELADALGVLSFLFLGGEVDCVDAADFDDSGVLSLPDAIGLLGFLYLGGPPPALPFPDPGLDPTPDGLGCETSL